jgi:hypothetical protein
MITRKIYGAFRFRKYSIGYSTDFLAYSHDIDILEEESKKTILY